MDHEKFPNYFLAVIVLYVIVFLISLSYFIIPSLSYAAGYVDYYLLLALFVLPLVLLAVYEKSSRFQLLWGKESAMRTIITALVVIDFVIDLYLMILLV